MLVKNILINNFAFVSRAPSVFYDINTFNNCVQTQISIGGQDQFYAKEILLIFAVFRRIALIIYL